MTEHDEPPELFQWGDKLDSFSVSRRFDPARLTQARFAAGLSKAKLADRVGVTPAAIGQYEAQIMAPRPELIPLLASELDVPTDYFATGRPIGRVDGSEAHFRSLRSTSARDRAKAIAFIEQVWELTFALEKKVRFPEVDLPTLTSGEMNGPADAAQALRLHWDLGDKPVPYLVAIAESRGIVISLLTLANHDVARVGAFSTSHLARPVIVVTPERAKSVFVHRFTIAHEIGHLLLHPDTIPGDQQQEREADQFAAEFLTPRDQIINLLPRSVNLSRLDQLSRAWGVSVESLLHRMKELGSVSEASIRRGYQRLHQMRAEGAESPEPIHAYPGEMPNMLNEAAQLADSHGYSLVDLATDLRWKMRRVREVLGAEDTRPALRLVNEPARDKKEYDMPNNNRRDVSPNGNNGWKVTKPGATRPTATAATQRAAEVKAKEQTLKAGGGQVFIHTPKGTIRDADTVKPGNESKTKDTKH